MFFKALREVMVPRRTQESVYDLQKARDELVACEGHLQAQDLVGKIRCAELASGWFFFGRHDQKSCWQFGGFMEFGELLMKYLVIFPKKQLDVYSLKKSSSGLVLPNGGFPWISKKSLRRSWDKSP